ncbi:MAG: TlpA family protein disulfide reductase [Planctomycetota bacterium]
MTAAVLALALHATATACFAFPMPLPQEAAPAKPVQDVAKDRERAEAALKSLIEAYRSEQGVRVSTEVTVGAGSGGGSGTAEPMKAEFVFGPKRQAVVWLRGFELHFFDGRVSAAHESNPLAYLEVSDHGSPYYALFNAFQSLPFPEIALALGEDAPDEVCMQLVPQVPNVVPVRVEADEIDGQAVETLVLESDDGAERLRLSYDSESRLVEHAVATISGGDMVEDGAELTWTIRSKSARPKVAPGREIFEFNSKGRQKVEGLAALIDRTAAGDRQPGAPEEPEPEADLAKGDPAPELALPKVGGGEFDLAKSRDRPVVLDFWATWCGPCRAAMPELAKLAEEFDGRATVLLVNTGEQGSREDRERRIREVLGERAKMLPCVLDLDGLAARRWLVRAFPTTMLVGTDGKIAGVWIGSTPRSQKELREKLASMCVPKAAP